MKSICLAVGLIAASGVAAQQPDLADLNKLIRQRIGKSQQQESAGKFSIPANPKILVVPKELTGKPEYTLPNGDQVYRLPTDQMPCVKPGHQQVYSMPVLPFHKELIQPGKSGNIPNPAL